MPYKKGFTVELVGYSGSGKTFLKDRLIKCSNSILNDGLFSKRSLLKYLFRKKGWEALVNSIRLLKFCDQNNPIGLIQSFRRWFLSQLRMLRSDELGKIHIIDEGPFQKFRYIRTRSKKQIILDGIPQGVLKKQRFPNILIVVYADAETITNRQVGRGDAKFSEANNKKVQKSYKDTIGDARAVAKINPTFKYVMIQNTEDKIFENIRIIKDCIHQYIK